MAEMQNLVSSVQFNFIWSMWTPKDLIKFYFRSRCVLMNSLLGSSQSSPSVLLQLSTRRCSSGSFWKLELHNNIAATLEKRGSVWWFYKTTFIILHENITLFCQTRIISRKIHVFKGTYQAILWNHHVTLVSLFYMIIFTFLHENLRLFYLIS